MNISIAICRIPQSIRAVSGKRFGSLSTFQKKTLAESDYFHHQSFFIAKKRTEEVRKG